MSHSLFIYGTLLVEKVRLRVLGRSCDCVPAILEGYRRCALSERSYPGLVSDAEVSVDGLLCYGLTEVELATLDRFEGDEYDRAKVTVETVKGTERAQTYLLSEKGMELLTVRGWDPEDFRKKDLDLFLREEWRDVLPTVRSVPEKPSDR